ncbi:hypothetical protein BpHYR1_022406, partial [Brachionus plicatilis]
PRIIFLKATFTTRSIKKKQYIKRSLVHNHSIKVIYKNADITVLNICFLVFLEWPSNGVIFIRAHPVTEMGSLLINNNY